MVSPRIARSRLSSTKCRKGIKRHSILGRHSLSYAILMLTVSSFMSLLQGSSASETAQPVVDCISSPAGMVAWYAGDGNADDIQGPTFEHGTPQGGVTFTTGQVGQAFTFDGVDDSVDLGSWFNLQTFTIGMWLKSEASQVAYADIIDNNHTDFRSWVVQYQNTGALYQYGSSDGVISFNLTPGQWQHLAITRDANRVSSLYLDGNLVGSVTGAGPLTYDGSEFLRLANWGGGGRNWKGQQDEVEIFNRALSQSEIQAVINAGSTGRCKPGPVQFSLSNYSTGEGDGRVDLLVTRSTGATAATVDYSSSDVAGLTNCSVVNGIASSRCDYATSVGRLSFALGEVSKTISIPIVDDSYAEGSENFTIALSNFIGVTLGSSSTATVTINDNEASSNGPNPIDGTAFFVRQHYIDFLNREPDPPGFAAWQAVINNCPGGDITCDRIHVSSAFFRSQEFQERGYFVYRFYSVGFGRKPDYVEFIPDLARVSGFLSPAELEGAKVAFIEHFMARPAFANVYNSLNNTQYVDTLLATAGITSASRDSWIGALTNNTKTRAQVLREIAESTDVYNKYFNQAFVVMQYFGYLRRDPDALYINWIQVLETTGDFRGMVNGFVNSLEYRLRFGPQS